MLQQDVDAVCKVCVHCGVDNWQEVCTWGERRSAQERRDKGAPHIRRGTQGRRQHVFHVLLTPHDTMLSQLVHDGLERCDGT